MKKNKAAKIIIIIFSIIALLSLGYMLYTLVLHPINEEKIYDNMKEDYAVHIDEKKKEVKKEVTIDDLKKKYSDDLVGWIKIKDTSIDYPVFYKKNDNDYYMNKNYLGNYVEGGSIFLNGYATPYSKNMTLYGHYWDVYYNTMFKDLTKFSDKDFFDKHKTIYYDTGYGNKEWKVAGVLYTNINNLTDYYTPDFKNNKEFTKYANDLISRCYLKNNVKILENDQLLTLSTCTAAYTDERIVVICYRTFPKE